MESPTVSQRTVRTPLRRYCRSRSRWLKGEGSRTLERPLMGREVVVAITAGKLDFGPWEQIFHGEFDGRRPKRVLVKVIGE